MALESLSEETYAATVAGLGYSLASTDHGFVIGAAGWSSKVFYALYFILCKV